MSTFIIFRREINQYFTSPFAYLIGFAILLITGIFFMQDLVISEEVKPANPAIVPNTLSLLMVFFAPLLTMRLLAEEKREGTLELLMTAPVPDASIVIGKFLGAWVYFGGLLFITLAYQVILFNITQPDIGHTISAYLGIWLYGGATLSVGLFFSAITENQIVSAFFTMITLILLWSADYAGDVIGNVEVARFVRSLSLQGHFSTSFSTGLVRAEDIAFFIGIIFVTLFVSIRAVESNRWK